MLVVVFSPSAFNNIEALDNGSKGGRCDQEGIPIGLDEAEPVDGGGRLIRLRLRRSVC